MATDFGVAYATMLPSFPPRSGGTIRAFEIVRALREAGFDAVLITPRGEASVGSPSDRPDWLREFDGALTRSQRVLRKARALRAGLPWAWSPGLSRRFAEELRLAENEGRRVIVANAAAAGIANIPRASWSRTIVDSHNLELIRAPRMVGGNAASGWNARRARRAEIEWIGSAFAFLVCSELERRVALTAVPGANVHVVENGVSADVVSLPVPDAPRAYFVGDLNYPPNSDGLDWLAREVWPLVRAAVPNAELLVAGSGVLPPLIESGLRSCEGVSFLGEVESVESLQRVAGVALVPILRGGGTRLKLLEAAAAGRAVVATSVGAEGLDLPGGFETASTAADFAQQTIRRLRDPDLVRREGAVLASWARGKQWKNIVRDALVPILVEVPPAGRRLG